MNSENRINKYTCEDCGGHVFTIDTDEGVTPFMIRCRATIGCNGMMQSSFYRCEPGTPTYEWRKPTPQEYRKFNSAMKDHCDQGGLNLYPIDGRVVQPQTNTERYREWKQKWTH